MNPVLSTLVQTGTPTVEARYVAFVRCSAAQARDWVEPLIMTWHGGRWHTTFINQRRIIGWLGPLPVLKVADIDGTGLGDGEMPVADVPEPTFAERYPDCPPAPPKLAYDL